MGVNKYTSILPLASRNKETCNHRRKKRGVKIGKYAIVFASTQLRLTKLRKYPIDPKAYLGRCSQHMFWLKNKNFFFSIMHSYLGA